MKLSGVDGLTVSPVLPPLLPPTSTTTGIWMELFVVVLLALTVTTPVFKPLGKLEGLTWTVQNDGVLGEEQETVAQYTDEAAEMATPGPTLAEMV